MLNLLVIFLISPLETRHFFLSLSLFFKAQSKMGCSKSTLFKGKDEEKAPCDREQEPSEVLLATATRRRKAENGSIQSCFLLFARGGSPGCVRNRQQGIHEKRPHQATLLNIN